MDLETIIITVKPLTIETTRHTLDKYGLTWQGTLMHQGIEIGDWISQNPMTDIIDHYLELCKLVGLDVPSDKKESSLRLYANMARGLLRFNTFINETLYVIYAGGTQEQVEHLRRQLLGDNFAEVKPLDAATMAELSKAMSLNAEFQIFDGTQSGFGLYFDRISGGMDKPIKAMMDYYNEFKPPVIYSSETWKPT